MLLLALVPVLRVLSALCAEHSHDSPVLAGPIGPDCVQGAKHEGEIKGTNITIAEVPTYYSAPSEEDSKKVILFFSDIYSPFYSNNQLLQDEFAAAGAP